MRPTAMSASAQLLNLDEVQASDGHLFIATLPPGAGDGDCVAEPRRSALVLLEDGHLIGRPHVEHDEIRALGGGRYSHWGDYLYFSASDRSSPLENGRIYQCIRLDRHSNADVAQAITLLEALPSDPRSDERYLAIESIGLHIYPEMRLGEDKKEFWREAGAYAQYRRVMGLNLRSFERKLTVREFTMSTTVPGSMAECGCYEGGTAFFMAQAARDSVGGRALHLFDSFEGLSQPQAVDGDHWAKGALTASEAVLRANLAEFSDVHIHRGWIPDRFGEVADLTFAVVHIDVDLYEPTLASLRFFYPRLARGGVLICDDSGFTTCPGAMRAMQEFFADKPERVIRLTTGQDLVIATGVGG